MRERNGHVKAVVLNGTTAPEILGHIFANYVDEVAFRLNEGNCKVKTMNRIDALFAKAVGVRLSYRDLCM